MSGLNACIEVVRKLLGQIQRYMDSLETGDHNFGYEYGVQLMHPSSMDFEMISEFMSEL